ncbi:MAG TPA: hypothetical protein VHR44_04930 [Beijerinckiaceae bacterium]|nr:hypothetical protein [Beijerinckiaceae bacterium]
MPVPEALAGSTQVAVAIGRRHAGTLVFIDALRPDAQSSIDTFRRQGIERIVLVTGDRAEIAESVARKLARSGAHRAPRRTGHDDRRWDQRRASFGACRCRRGAGRTRRSRGLGGRRRHHTG